MTEEQRRRPGRTYEVMVAGQLGPVLRAAFSDQSVRQVPPCTVLLLHGGSWDEVVELLTAAGLWVQEVRITRSG